MECPICFNKIKKTINYCVTDCKHSFCLECMILHMRNKRQKSRNKCPICRNKLYVKHSDSDDSEPEDSEPEDSEPEDSEPEDSTPVEIRHRNIMAIDNTTRIIQQHRLVQTMGIVHTPIFFFVNKIHVPATVAIYLIVLGSVMYSITNGILKIF